MKKDTGCRKQDRTKKDKVVEKELGLAFASQFPKESRIPK